MKTEKKGNCSCSQSSCCSSKPEINRTLDKNEHFITGWMDSKTEVGEIPRISTKLNLIDQWGAIKVRLGIKRMRYAVKPGLYAIGNPNSESIVLVTANYKLTFDTLRMRLTGLDAWILVLDTRGINVWCAAGKGTFSTTELVNRIELTGLKKIVKHRQLIVPQLGATGVSAHKVKTQSGFTVNYGPVRAEDIPAFLDAGQKAEPEMRRVTFTFIDRLKITPIEIVMGLKYLVIFCVLLVLLSGLSRSGYFFNWKSGVVIVFNLLVAYLAGTFIAPVLLPWLPGRTFSLKGALVGGVSFILLYLGKMTGGHLIQVLAWLLLISSLASFFTMNFTGSSTFTSLSGVKKEMRIAVPLQFTAAVVGLALWIIAKFL